MKDLTIIATRSDFTDLVKNSLSRKVIENINVYHSYKDFENRILLKKLEVVLVLVDGNHELINKVVKIVKNLSLKIPFIFCIKNTKNKIVPEIIKYFPNNIISYPSDIDQLFFLITLKKNILLNMMDQGKNIVSDNQQIVTNTSTWENQRIENDYYTFVKSGTNIFKIQFGELLYIQSEHVYIILNSGNKKVPIRAKLDDIENHLPKRKFQRIHQRYIVNIDHITKVNSEVVYIQDIELPLSSKYKRILLDKMDIFH